MRPISDVEQDFRGWWRNLDAGAFHCVFQLIQSDMGKRKTKLDTGEPRFRSCHWLSALSDDGSARVAISRKNVRNHGAWIAVDTVRIVIESPPE